EAWWWKSGQALPEAGRLDAPFAKAPFAWRTNQGSVTVEGLSVRKFRLDGGREVQGLVVRLSYPADKEPYFVQLRDWEGGQEHRFYTEAGKYTAVFYPMTEEQAKEQTALLVSVEDFKKKALTLKEGRLKLGAPNDSPRPPVP